MSLIIMLALLIVAPIAHAGGTVRCTTYEEKTLGRLHTVCSDGARGVSTYNKTLQRWESTITPPPGKANPGRPAEPRPGAPRRR